MKAAWIRWEDATSCDAWTDYIEASEMECHTIETLGFIISDSAERLVLALSCDKTEGAVSNYIAIPKSWIRELVYLPEFPNF